MSEEQANCESQEAETADSGDLEVHTECKNDPGLHDHPEDEIVKTTENDEQPVLDQGDEPLSIYALRDPTLRYANPHGTFITGMDVNSEEAAKKRLQRAARFGLSEDKDEQGVQEEGEVVEKRQARAKRFGTKVVAYKGEPVKLVDKLPDVPDGDLRSEVIHLYGTDEMSTEDVFTYFQAYAPRNIEWINDSSCNVVWEDAESAARALCGLSSQPVALRSEFTEESESVETGEDETVVHQQREGDVQWRLGVECPRAKQLLMRFAVLGDCKVSGSSQRSNYYRKYGNPNKRAMSWREKPSAQDIGSSNPSKTAVRTWRDKPIAQDLRNRLGKRERDKDFEEEEEEAMDTLEIEQLKDPLAKLVKRPKPLHSERSIEEVEEKVYVEDSEKQRLGELANMSGTDLRKRIQKSRKRRDLKLRLGHNPRLVERTL